MPCRKQSRVEEKRKLEKKTVEKKALAHVGKFAMLKAEVESERHLREESKQKLHNLFGRYRTVRYRLRPGAVLEHALMVL